MKKKFHHWTSELQASMHGQYSPSRRQGAVVQWEHAAHVSDFQSERGFESRQVQQFFAQRVALRTDTICLPKPIGTMALT